MSCWLTFMLGRSTVRGSGVIGTLHYYASTLTNNNNRLVFMYHNIYEYMIWRVSRAPESCVFKFQMWWQRHEKGSGPRICIGSATCVRTPDWTNLYYIARLLRGVQYIIIMCTIRLNRTDSFGDLRYRHTRYTVPALL